MRLVTRADLDGLVCALLFTAEESFDEVVLVHPQEITEKTVEIRSDDTLANVPYHPDCGRWFDHHLLTASNETPPDDFVGIHRVAPSAARLVWEFVGEPAQHVEMVRQTDRFDSAQLDADDVLRPTDWILLGFTVDPRSGLPDHEDYFRFLLDALSTQSLREVLLRTEVQSRVKTMFAQNEDFAWALTQQSRLVDKVVFTDFRGLRSPPAGNRFLIYTLFPEATVSLRAQYRGDRIYATAGHSIFDRTCPVSIGEMMSDYGGGGHRGAGSAPLPALEADRILFEMLDRLNGMC